MILPVGEYRCTLCKFSITAKTKLCLTIGAKLQVKSRTPCILFRSSTILSWLQFYKFITGTFTYLEKSARGSQLPLESSDEEILDELASWSFCESRRNSAKNKTKKKKNTNRHPIKNKQTKQNSLISTISNMKYKRRIVSPQWHQTHSTLWPIPAMGPVLATRGWFRMSSKWNVSWRQTCYSHCVRELIKEKKNKLVLNSCTDKWTTWVPAISIYKRTICNVILLSFTGKREKI